MNNEEIKKVLDLHKKWLNGKPDGVRADLRGADLRGADLRGADLSYADLSYADLKDADLRGANIDFSCFTLWCGGLDVNIDDTQAIQLMYHLIRNVQYSKNVSDEIKCLLCDRDIVALANRFHRVKECGEILNERDE